MNKPAPKIYRTTNWSCYNQALINRGNLSIWFDPNTQWYAQPQGKQGRNQTYSDVAIQCCLMMKSLFRLSLRMVTGFVQSLISFVVWRPRISVIFVFDPLSQTKGYLYYDSLSEKSQWITSTRRHYGFKIFRWRLMETQETSAWTPSPIVKIAYWYRCWNLANTVCSAYY